MDVASYKITKILLTVFFAAVVDCCVILLGAQHREPHSMHQEHQEGTNGCSPGTSMVIFFPPSTGFASGRLMDDHPCGNQSFL